MNTFDFCTIHLQGVDKTGKTSVKKALLDLADGRAVVIDRSFMSQIVYGRIYSRGLNELYYKQQIKDSIEKLGHVFIYFYSDLNIVQKRFIEHNEKDLSINDIESHQIIFEDVANEVYKFCNYSQNIIFINSSGTLEATLSQIIDKLIKAGKIIDGD